MQPSSPTHSLLCTQISKLTSVRFKSPANEFAAIRAKSAGADSGKSRFEEPTQVSFALIAAVLTTEILIPNSRYPDLMFDCGRSLGRGVSRNALTESCAAKPIQIGIKLGAWLFQACENQALGGFSQPQSASFTI